MKIDAQTPLKTYPEPEIFESLLSLDNQHILELGCGDATLTRIIASTGENRTITATEVDTIQHQKNELIDDLPGVSFKLAGCENIPAPDDTFDTVFMFKSLHHVPGQLLGKALKEIERVLKQDGLAYISEPLFSGDFNEVLCLFHHEEVVRKAAFDALEKAVKAGTFRLVEERFFNTSVSFDNFEQFSEKVIGSTHSQHNLSAELLSEVKQKFNDLFSKNGGDFTIPIRVDLLRIS
ncbi:MAG: class I SAM-dependent methyltransferase [Gammaproteobacteria bacterium]|nr:class I SAM-dependent methyltransferase [Gammaproteobacteria bacterium]